MKEIELYREGLEFWQIRLYKLYPSLKEISQFVQEKHLVTYFVNRGLSFDDAQVLAEATIRQAKAEQFIKERLSGRGVRMKSHGKK